MSEWTPATARLVELLGRTARGPRREGLFAIWLVVRAAEDLTLEPPLPPKLVAKRLEGLRHRLATLTLPAPVRRGVTTAMSLLDEGTPASGTAALHQLTAPVREALGPEAGEAVAGAVRAAKGERR
jgi:hypothetical protein